MTAIEALAFELETMSRDLCLSPTVAAFVQTVRSLDDDRARQLAHSLYGLLLFARDAMCSGQRGDHAVLCRLTDDRGEVMERFRRTSADLPSLTVLFEHAVLLLRTLAQATQCTPSPKGNTR